MDTYGNTQLSRTSLRLLGRLRSREWDISQFLGECAYWTLREGFADLTPSSLPTPPDTDAFREFSNLSPAQKKKMQQDFFFQNPEINAYFGKVFFVHQENMAVLKWLQEIREYVPREDILSLEKIEVRILEFQAFFDENPVVKKIRNTFRAKITNHRKSYYSVNEVLESDGEK